jgi:hypothetical protein
LKERKFLDVKDEIQFEPLTAVLPSIQEEKVARIAQ